MSMSDPVSDFLTRIRNAIQARKPSVECPRSNLKVRIAEILRQEGFVSSVSEANGKPQGRLALELRWNSNGNAIRGLRRVSRPGQRWYVGARDLPKVRNGLGIAIVSTSRGVMTDREARKLGVGGEVICEVW
jgi:small subunit ribosomal protein S8